MAKSRPKPGKNLEFPPGTLKIPVLDTKLEMTGLAAERPHYYLDLRRHVYQRYALLQSLEAGLDDYLDRENYPYEKEVKRGLAV